MNTHIYIHKRTASHVIILHCMLGEHENINLLRLNAKKVTYILQISFAFKLYTYMSQVWRNQKWSSLPDF